MNKTVRLTSYIIGLIFLLFAKNVSAISPFDADTAERIDKQSSAFGSAAGFLTTTFAEDIVATIIQAFLSLLSMIFIILILYAGYNWMTAGGDEQKVTKAKDTIYRAVIGLVITISAFVLTYFVFNALPFGGGPAVAP
ncbi:MAG: hypothetical protein NTW06_02160 [Candidatus Falkowbacteria bacterium]|nr:hypothetical protein [Candidatus Falkowbacteria bacterium]